MSAKQAGAKNPDWHISARPGRSDDLLSRFDNNLKVAEHWQVNGVHYARTLRAWLDRMDDQRDDILDLFRTVYGEADAKRWVQRWRMFFMACEELFAYKGGEEWMVGHYLLEKAAGGERR